MSDIGAIITAGVGVLGALGAAGKFVWNKVEAREVRMDAKFEERFRAVEAALAECRERESRGVERRGRQYTVIELLRQELQRHAPESWALQRAKGLLDELKRTDTEGEGT